VLLTGSGDKFCGSLSALLQPVAYHPSTVSLPAFPSVCLLIVHMEISSLPLPPSLVCFQCFCFSLCTSFQFVVYCSGVLFVCLFVCRGGFSLPKEQCWFIPGGLGEYHEMLGTHLFSLPNVSQAGLELAAGSSGSPPVTLLCNVV
jgi:hypothetical protein